MNIVNLLAKLANNVHYSKEYEKAINELPEKIRQPFQDNKTEHLKSALSLSNVFPNECHVVEVNF